MSLLVPDFTPEHFFTLDFESFYDDAYTLKKLTTSDYIRDPRFETIGVGVDDGDECVWMEDAEFRAWAKTVPWEKTALLAHHAQFDALILSHHYDIHPAVLLCTMSMARGFGVDGSVSLASLAEHFGVGVKGHEVLQAKGKHRKDFTQEEWEQYGVYCRNDVALCKAIYEKMVEGGFPEAELWLVSATVKMFSEPKLLLDEPLLQQYLVDERQRKKELLERLTDGDLKELRSTLMSNEKFAKLLQQLGEEPPRKLSPTTKKETWAFAKSDPGMQALLDHSDDAIRWVSEARIATKSTINETRAERFLKMCAGGRTLPVYLRYAAAHTFRWGGGDRTNLQNLQRTNKKKPERGVIKKALLAPPGHKVVAVDSGAIEARVLAWLADHEELLAGFRENRDIYSEFASEVYGRHVDRKKNPEDEQAGNLGKTSILGLGFGLGWFKFSDILLKGPMGSDPIQFLESDAQTMGVNLNRFRSDGKKMAKVENMLSRLDREALTVHCAVSDFVVKKYRTKNQPVVDFWRTAEDVIEAMATLEGDDRLSFGPGECLQVVRHGIILPNGLTMKYPGLRDDGEGYSYLGQYGKMRAHIYGGLLTENLVQALARIIVGEQLLHVAATTGYWPALFAHDELGFVADDDDAPLLFGEVLRAMKTPPAWAAGLPLSAEGGFSTSYGYAK